MREPPFTFGDYEVTDVIAQGGMGIVYRAHQRSLNRNVALKMIRSGSLASPEELQRFRTEAEAAATLDHPGIVPIYEVGETDGQPYFSMRLVDGTSLEARAHDHVGDARWAASLVERVARAVHHAHLRGILHRDLKPGNVLLEEGDRPVVTDFGLARRLDATGTRYTVTGIVLGTPAYMAPEQARGDARAVTTAADIWSLGVLLYELAAGRLPFHGSNMMDLLGSVLSDEPRPLSQLLPRVPLDFETICLKCLRKEPRDRYLTAGDLADDLARFLRGEPVAARPQSTIERAVRWTRRHPTKSVTVAFLALAIVGGLSGLTAYYRFRATTEEEAARHAKAGEDLARARSFSDHDAPALAGLYFAGANRVEPSLAARVGIEAHRVPIPLHAAKLDSGPIWRILFDPQGKVVAGTSRGVWTWDMQDGRVAPMTPDWEFGDEVHGLALDAGRLITGHKSGAVALWDLASGKRLAECPGAHKGLVSSISLVDGGRVVAFPSDENLWLWHLDDAAAVPIPFEPDPPVSATKIEVKYVKANPASTTLLVAASITVDEKKVLGQARLFDLASGRFRDGSIEFEGEPWCADFSHDGDRVAVSGDLSLLVSEGVPGDRSETLPGLYPMGAVAFGADQATVVVADNRGNIMRWDPDAHHEVGPPLLPECATYAVAITPDGSKLVTGGEDGFLRCWAMPKGDPPAYVVRGLKANLAAPDAEDRRLLAITMDGRLALADLATGRVTHGEAVPGNPGRIACTGDGWWIFVNEPGVAHWLEALPLPDGRMKTRTIVRRAFEGPLGVGFVPGDGLYVSTPGRVLSRLGLDGKEEPVAEGMLSFDVSRDGNVLALLYPTAEVAVRKGGIRGRRGPAGGWGRARCRSRRIRGAGGSRPGSRCPAGSCTTRRRGTGRPRHAERGSRRAFQSRRALPCHRRHQGRQDPLRRRRLGRTRRSRAPPPRAGGRRCPLARDRPRRVLPLRTLARRRVRRRRLPLEPRLAFEETATATRKRNGSGRSSRPCARSTTRACSRSRSRSGRSAATAGSASTESRGPLPGTPPLLV